MFLIFIAPDGKSMDYTLSKVKEFEKIALNHPDIKKVVTAVGGFGSGGQSNRGNGVLILKDPEERIKGQFDIADELRNETKSIEGIKIIIRDRTGGAIGGRRGNPIEFTISGPDNKKQIEIYNQFKEKMDADPRIVGTRSDDVAELPEVHIKPNRIKAQQRGVEVGEIVSAINASLGGIVAGQYTTGGRRFDIFVQLQEENRQKSEDLKNILIRNNRGEMLPLIEVVDIVKTEGPQSIFREDRVRGVRVDASLSKGAKTGEVISAINQWAGEILPEGYYLNFSDTPQSKLLETLMIMLLGLLIAYMILASQFNSFIDPLLVFLAIPFGITGALFALLLGGQSLNLYSMIGIILTIGIVKKNSILLVEFTNQLRDQGKDILEALKEACHTRLRPILMTNTATLAAAIPPALALGPGAETRIPMALTVIGGVALSMIFTLFVVPCAYLLISPKRIDIKEES